MICSAMAVSSSRRRENRCGTSPVIHRIAIAVRFGGTRKSSGVSADVALWFLSSGIDRSTAAQAHIRERLLQMIARGSDRPGPPQNSETITLRFSIAKPPGCRIVEPMIECSQNTSTPEINRLIAAWGGRW
jgi:hypothetical protein